MIKVIEKKTLSGKIIKTYELTQGDSFKFRAYIKQNTPLTLVKSIIFKLLDNEYNILFAKEYVKKDLSNWYLTVTTQDTNKWEVRDDYKTEIEVTYEDDQVDTIEKADLIVTRQGKEAVNDI